MELVITQKAELQQLIADAISLALKQTEPQKHTEGDKLLTQTEAAGILRCSKPTIIRLVKQNILKSYRLGANVPYKFSNKESLNKEPAMRIHTQRRVQNVRRSFRSKNNSSISDLQTIFLYLEKKTVTAAMLAKATGVPHKSITRYKRDLEKRGRLAEVRKDLCRLTGHKAWYLTTNPRLFPATRKGGVCR